MDSSAHLPLVAVAAVTTISIGLVSYMFMKNKKTDNSSSSSSSSTSKTRASSFARSSISSSSKENSTITNTNNKDDVWEERRRNGIEPAKTSTSKTNGTINGDKPFGSSYYYAHNSSNAKGGYSDGLRMEDFTMNGPRLLSKGGKPIVVGDDDDDDDDNDTNENNDSGSDNVVERKDSAASDLPARDGTGENKSAANFNIKRKTLAISKYLWDDPGDKKGVATIRIDSLPDSRRSSETLEWKDAQVVEATAELIGETELLVIVKTQQQQEYRLHIKQLYGKATSVQAILKSKRLLVKLQKKKGFMQLSNIAAWPHPQQKVGRS